MDKVQEKEIVSDPLDLLHPGASLCVAVHYV
jgi:hypothetical protein